MVLASTAMDTTHAIIPTDASKPLRGLDHLCHWQRRRIDRHLELRPTAPCLVHEGTPYNNRLTGRWPGLLVMRRVPRPRVLRAGLGSRLSFLKTRNPELPPLSPNNPAAYADSVFCMRIFLDNGLLL